MNELQDGFDHKEHQCYDMMDFMQDWEYGQRMLCCICIGHKCGEEEVYEAVDRYEENEHA